MREVNINRRRISAKFVSRLNKQRANQGGGWVYTHAALAARGVLVADDVTGIGVIDDIAIPVIVVGAVAHDLYTNCIVNKMAREIDRIAQKVKGPQGFTYALVAKPPGLYPNVRGDYIFKCR
nr:hypothetical protein [Pedobacter panaciterrae]